MQLRIANFCRSAVIACSALLFPATAHVAGASGAKSFDFAYRLSGDRRVAPIQVFDDGSTTWLQYHPGQVLPAIFAAAAGDTGSLQLAAYTRQGPYLVLDGVVSTIVMRLGNATARADYIGNAPRTGLRLSSHHALQAWQHAAISPAADQDVAFTVEPEPTSAYRAAANPSGARPASASGAEAYARVASPQAAQQYRVLEFDAAVSDGNMRKVLQRWARDAGWRFDNEHWAVDVDIPLTASASFGSDFREAVRGLLSATELADHPLQPCFYSNRVLRVVPLSQPCDRTVSPVAALAPLS